MNKKIFLTSMVALMIACPAYAVHYDPSANDPNRSGYIDTNDQSADCDTLPLTYNGSSPQYGTYYLAAQWEEDECPITLNSHTGANEYGSTASDPTTLYARYADNVYLSVADRTASTNAMSTSANGLTTNPTGKTYTLTLNTNVTTAGTGGMNAAHTDSQVTAASGTKAASTTATMSFAGFFDATQLSKTQTNGTQYIDDGNTGKITQNGITAGTSISKVNGTCPSTEWHAQYTCQNAATYTPQLTGYTFAGWYDAANNGNQVNDFCLDSNKTVYAHWTPRTKTITLDPNNAYGGDSTINTTPYPQIYGVYEGDVYRTSTLDTGEKMGVASGNSPQSQLTEAGVNLSALGSGKKTIPTGEQLTLTLNTNAPTNPSNSTQYSVSYTPTNATLTGRRSLLGYYSSTGGNTKYINGSGDLQYYLTQAGGDRGACDAAESANMPSCLNDETWYAHWSCVNVTLPSNSPTLTGYTFDGWYDAANGGNQVPDSFCATANTTIYAQWTATTHTVTYDCNGGTIASPNIVESAGATTATDTVTYDDLYAFVSQADLCTYQNQTPSGWSCTNATPWYTQQNWQIDNDVVCTAQWNATPYTITYDCGSLPNNGGTVNGGTFEDGTNNVDTVYNGMPMYLVRQSASGCGTGTQLDGYHFAGWTCTPNLATGSSSATYFVNWPTSSTVSTTIDSIGLSGNATCEAKWAENTVNLIYLEEAGDATPYDTDTCVYGNSSFNLPSQPTKTGYTFTGWKVTNHQ